MTIIRFTPENVAKVPNAAGLYALFGRGQSMLYVGTSEVLRHRLQSYYQTDGYHPTKEELRPLIKWFYYERMSIEQARRLEKEVKGNLQYNFR